MIIVNLKINNFYSFKNFEVNFTYPRKINNSLIDGEYIEEIPQFRFKRLNIIMGANSAGKTTFGKILMQIFNFIQKQKPEYFSEAFKEIRDEAEFEIDIVQKESEANKSNYILYRLRAVFTNMIIEDEQKIDIKTLALKNTKLGKNDSYEKAVKKLKNINEYEKDIDDKEKIGEILEKIGRLAWFFNFPSVNDFNRKMKNLKIASKILKTFDNTIETIKEVENTENGYQIIFKNRDSVLIQNGKVVDKEALSSGTEEALGICYSIDQMLAYPDRPFYIDEKFSHTHSELEKTLLSIMVELIGKEAQLFFTTHNTEILTINFPVHSFLFFSKNEDGDIKVTYPEKTIKRNDRNLINYVKNNVFDTIPDNDLLYEIIDVVEQERRN